MPPRQEQVDTVLRNEPLVSENSEELVSEEELSSVFIDVGKGIQSPSGVHTPLEEMAWMWGFHFREEAKIWMTATMPGRASGSSTAAAIISRTVS